MKKIHFILLSIFGLVLTSCQTNDIISFNTGLLDTTQYAEVRLLNVIPVTGNSDTLLFNGQKYSSVSTIDGGYYPYSTPKYYSLPLGNINLSLNFNAKTTTPTVAAFKYSGSMILQKGKWSAYIYNSSQNPIILQDADNIPTTDPWQDTLCFIKVANFFFKADGVTPFGKITLKAKKNFVGANWETVASNIAFGTQSSAYYLYRLKNITNLTPWSGIETNVTFAVFDSTGVQYQQFTSATSSIKGAYSSSGWSLGKGRAYVIYLNGKEGTSNNKDQFIRLSSYNTR
jgi:hypothetical protein